MKVIIDGTPLHLACTTVERMARDYPFSKRGPGHGGSVLFGYDQDTDNDGRTFVYAYYTKTGTLVVRSK